MGLKSSWNRLFLGQEFNVPNVSSLMFGELGNGRDEFEKHILSRKKVDGGEEVFLDNGLTYVVTGEGEGRKMQLVEKIVSFVRE